MTYRMTLFSMCAALASVCFFHEGISSIFAFDDGIAQPKVKGKPKEFKDFVKDLESESYYLRVAAVKYLIKLGPEAKPAIPALTALVKKRPPGPEKVPPQKKGRPDYTPDNMRDRSGALMALTAIDPMAIEIMPTILSALSDPEDNLSGTAAHELYLLQFRQVDVVPVLLKTMAKADGTYRRRIIEVLGDIGAGAKASASALLEAINDQDTMIAIPAAIALWKVAKYDPLPMLVKHLKSEDPKTGEAATRALGSMGRDARASVPTLLAALEDQKDNRPVIVWALGEIRGDPKVIVPVLIRALKDKDPKVRGYATGSLRCFGVDAKEAISDLIQALNDEDQDVRRGAYGALNSIDPDTAKKYDAPK